MKTIFSWIKKIFKRYTLDHHVFWYFRYGAQKEDKHWFSGFESEDKFVEWIVDSRGSWLITPTIKTAKSMTMDILKTIPPLGGSMSEKLDNEIIREWWKKVAEHARESGLKDYQGIHEPLYHQVMNSHRIMVAQIRTEQCYNYLCSMGVEVNANGEIFLSADEALQYVQFQRMMED